MISSETKLNTADAAEYLGLHEQTLKRWRMTGHGPKYHRLGLKKIYYLESEIDEWQEDGVTRT